MELICFFVSFLSSAVGAICGIGGGVVIKPVLDFVQMGSAGMINFLSGCTVLSMSLYSVGKAMLNRDGKVNLAIGTPLALGATLGGVAGKKLFAMVNAFFPNGAMVGGVQAAILALITVGTLLYTVAKSKITWHHLQFPGHRRRSHQSGGAGILLQYGQQNRSGHQPVYHPVQSAGKFACCTDFRRAGLPSDGPGVDGSRRNRRWHCGARSEQKDGQPGSGHKLFIILMVLIIAICIFNAMKAFG